MNEENEIDDDDEFITYSILVTNAVLVSRLGGRVVIPQAEWEEARKLTMRTEMNGENMIVNIVSNSQERTDVH